MNKIIAFSTVLLLILSCTSSRKAVKKISTGNTFFLGPNGKDERSEENVVFLDPGKGKLVLLHYDKGIDPENPYIRKGVKSFEKKAKLITKSQKVFSSSKDPRNSSHLHLRIDGDNKLIQNPRGFTITSNTDERTGNIRLSVTSPTEVGILYAIEYFNLNFLGFLETQPNIEVRHPDKTSTHVGYAYEVQYSINLPRIAEVINPGPDFDLRIWTGESQFNRTAWLQDEAKNFEIGTQLYQYHHNLFNIFKSAQKKDWQPEFSDQKNIIRAQEYVDSMFTRFPDLRSVSLSVNDGVGYQAKDVKVDDKGKYNLARTYVAFVNEVARYTSRNWPGKNIAILQYNKVADPTAIPYEDNVIVFLLNEIKHKYARWNKNASKFGYYQWLYGRRYIFPNYGLTKLKNVLHWCIEHEIDLYKGEFYGAWAIDGLRIWVLSNLLWNSVQDINNLVTYYLENQYGPGAGDMAEFFDFCEDIFNVKFEKYNIGFSNTAYPGEYNFYELDIKTVEKLSDLLLSAKRKIRNHQKNNGRDRNRYLFNIEASIKAFDWFAYYFRIYDVIYKRKGFSVNSLDKIHSELENLDQAVKAIEGLQNYFKKNLTGTAPYSIFSESYKESEPRIPWKDFEKYIDLKIAMMDKYLHANNPEAFVYDFWQEASKKYLDINHFLSRYCKSLELRDQVLVEYSFEKRLEIDDGRLEKYLNRNIIDNIEFVDKEETYVSLSGVGDYTGIKYTKLLKTDRTYTFSFMYKTLNLEIDNVILITSFTKNQTKREFIEPSKEWKEKSIILSFDKNSRKEEIQGLFIILSLKDTNSLNQKIQIKKIRLIEN